MTFHGVGIDFSGTAQFILIIICCPLQLETIKLSNTPQNNYTDSHTHFGCQRGFRFPLPGAALLQTHNATKKGLFLWQLLTGKKNPLTPKVIVNHVTRV